MEQGLSLLTEADRGQVEEGSQRGICFRREVSSEVPFLPCAGHAIPGVRMVPGPSHIQSHFLAGILTSDDKALFVNMLLICNFENKIETSCILKYKMKCDALYTT